MAFSVKLSQKTQTGGINPIVATRTLLDDISSTSSTVSFDKEVTMTGNVTIGDSSNDSLLLIGGRIQSQSTLEWSCKDNESNSFKIGSSDVKNLINIDTTNNNEKVTIRNLEVINNLTEIDTVNLTITDPLIKLGNNNPNDTLDLGFYAQYNDSGTIKYAGLFRGGNNDSKFRLFTELQNQPNTTVNTTHPTYTPATLVVGSLEGNVTGNITGNVSGSAATVTNATQSTITSLGTLTSVQVDNINIDGNTISSTAGTDLNITPLSGQQIVLDGTIVVDAGVVTNATSITSTDFVGNLTGDLTGNVTGDLTGNVTGNADTATTTDRIIGNSNIPSTTGDTGTAGEIRYDTANEFLYVCINTNTWRRVSLSSWV